MNHDGQVAGCGEEYLGGKVYESDARDRVLFEVKTPRPTNPARYQVAD